jgi:hypothetical protein
MIRLSQRAERNVQEGFLRKVIVGREFTYFDFQRKGCRWRFTFLVGEKKHCVLYLCFFGTTGETARTAQSNQQFLPIAACPVPHLVLHSLPSKPILNQ